MSELRDRLVKTSTIKATDVLGDSIFFTEVDMVLTAVPMMNVALSGRFDGGLTPGLTMFAGPSKHFKTIFSLVLVKAYLDKYPEAICLFYDSEFGTPQSYFNNMGIDLSRVIHTPIMNIEEMKHDIMNQLDGITRKDKVIIVIDSIGNMASKKEVDDAIEGKSVADMTRAKQLKSLGRMVTPHLLSKNIPMVVINHTYKEIGMYPKDIVSGGCLDPDEKIIMANGSLRRISDVLVGEEVMTMVGPKEVTQVWDQTTLYDGTPECYRVYFEDGTSVICSNEHKFLIGETWITAEDLTEGDDVITV
jgi:RecA/RadA recombinase